MRNRPGPAHFLSFPAIAALFACAVVTAACGSSGNTMTSPSNLSKCAVTVDSPGSTVPASGGAGTINVSTERECQWSAQPEVTWVSIVAGSSGQGSGTVQFNVGANADPTARSGGVMVNGQRAQVSQAAGECRFELSSNATAFAQAGGSGSVDVRASSPLCTWTASSDVDWIAVNTNASGKGSAPVTFTVAATTGPPRVGTLTIAGQHFSVTESEGCSYTISPATFAPGASGGSQAVTVTAGAGCPWTAASNAPWLSVGTASGTGSSVVVVTAAPTSGPSRSGNVTIAGQLLTVTQSPGCSFDVSPLSLSADPAGGTRTVNVSTGSGCSWTASSNQPWVTITSNANGSGSGTVTVSVAADTGPARSGTITVAGQTVTIAQGQGCTFAISPDSLSIAAAGGNTSVSVTSGAGCAWTATSAQPWVTITSGASGNGNGTVNFTVASTNGPGRSGTLTIAGRTFTINQGQGCTFSLPSNSASATAAGGSGTFDVRAASGCGWAANSNAAWLSIVSGATGSGNGTVQYSAAANTGPERSGTITAAGQAFTVTQSAGCSYSMSPTSQNIASGGGPLTVAVTAPAGCSWNATNPAPWITVSSGGSGSGAGPVQLVVAPNPDADRQGTVTIATQTYTVFQASGCTFSLSPSSTTVPAAGGTGTFTVTTSGGCTWTAAPTAPWITVTPGQGGSGSGMVQFTAAPNSGAQRSGTITAGGQSFTVAQDSGCSAVVAPDTFTESAAGASENVNVTTAPDCAWTAISNAPWIGIAAGGGTGAGSVRLDIQNNSGPARTGSATIAGKPVTVNQATGCTIMLSSMGDEVGPRGDIGSVNVSSGPGCPWTAVSDVTWIEVTSAPSDAGNGKVTYRVAENPTPARRTGTITIGGQLYTVNQRGF
jgi:hypothetical protein